MTGPHRTAGQHTKAIEGILEEDFRDRILPFDRQAASTYAAIAAVRRTAGRPISQFDCQIAVIARAHGASVATRNTGDFEGCGVQLMDLWSHVDVHGFYTQAFDALNCLKLLWSPAQQAHPMSLWPATMSL